MTKKVKSEKPQAINPDDVLRRMLSAPPRPHVPKKPRKKPAK
jgi:hypothetical protein